MSRKTRLALPPGTPLDPDNEDHQPYIMEEAFAEMDRHPKPTMPRPERSRWWWFWRAFGLFVYMPSRKYLSRYLACRYVPPVYGEHARPGYDVYTWPLARGLHTWIQRGSKWGPRAFWFRTLLRWLTDINVYDQCSWCGFTGYCDEHEVQDRHGDTIRTINMFELVEGGDVNYWGEGQDAYGWKWCYRCGAVEWEVS